ncbi:hypothetical protein Lalb_Chr01g0021381 [Lupinus albus]|uniref:Uncharacterized protein n=1 Tax=Lupinus albus TaxID=3870 RepID=A0A6A4RB92_LUPAL|nr:hypothetical protein Lalb_Chr01g0021381 [Lupinus albus]
MLLGEVKKEEFSNSQARYDPFNLEYVFSNIDSYSFHEIFDNRVSIPGCDLKNVRVHQDLLHYPIVSTNSIGTKKFDPYPLSQKRIIATIIHFHNNLINSDPSKIPFPSSCTISSPNETSNLSPKKKKWESEIE